MEMKEMVDLLNRANDAYYNKSEEIMSNYEYDKLYDELLALEKETGIILPNSPTQKAGYETVSNLKKVQHEFPALSLDKTKEMDDLISWLKEKDGILSWKLDGATVVFSYSNGKLLSAVTRGNGIVGDDITHNAKFFKGIPTKIDYKGHLVVRGEAMISYQDFENINATIQDIAAKYKNPRNLASGSVRLLDSEESSKRNVSVEIFELVYKEEMPATKTEGFQFLKELGFNVVENYLVKKDTLSMVLSYFKENITKNQYSSDGLVLTYNDIAYGNSLGQTGKFPKHSIAFKWEDAIEKTKLIKVDWSCSKNSLNPVAVFESVELEGTSVSRASIHNVSIFKQLQLGIGDIITVYKANMIIPQIAENLTKSNTLEIPSICPVCGSPTELKKAENSETEVLCCSNEFCVSKLQSRLEHFVDKDSMNIEGFSSATIERFIDLGWVKEIKDFYRLKDHKEDMILLDGFGEKSTKKLLAAVEKSRTTKLENFIRSLSIHNVGRDASKKISNYVSGEFPQFMKLLENSFSFDSLDGIGEVINQSLYHWYHNLCRTNQLASFLELANELSFMKEEKRVGDSLKGKIFVITGSLEKFKNREEAVKEIESLGGKVSGSVSAKTSYLVNNDILSNSSKNKKAKELGVSIITEEELISLVKGE